MGRVQIGGGDVSVIEEFKGLEDRVAQRLAELRPLVDEYNELEQIAERLGLSQTRATARTARARGTSPRPRASASTNARSARRPGGSRGGATRSGGSRTGGRRDQLLAVVQQQPGITVREVGSRLGVDPTSLYRIVHRLEQDGAVRKDGRALLPA
jgi:CRP-like cAMP-binding protein